MEIASLVISIVSVAISLVTYCITVTYEKRKVTIEAIHVLQNEVLDKLVSIDKENAIAIIEALDDEKCKEAYDDYRTLIARIEHFAIGVNKHIYVLGIVNDILGRHFIALKNKVMPIIEHANRNEPYIRHYGNFVKLVKRLYRKQKKLRRRL